MGSPIMEASSPSRKRNIVTAAPPKPQYNVSVQQIVDNSLRILPFGIDLYFPPKVERAYLLKPHLGK
jgi:hypothetical protein